MRQTEDNLTCGFHVSDAVCPQTKRNMSKLCMLLLHCRIQPYVASGELESVPVALQLVPQSSGFDKNAISLSRMNNGHDVAWI